LSSLDLGLIGHCSFGVLIDRRARVWRRVPRFTWRDRVFRPQSVAAAGDFDPPKTALDICAFWRLDALARVGRGEAAHKIFEAVLLARNHFGLMAGGADAAMGEMRGNSPQACPTIGIINGARRLSRLREAVV
jgi:GH15 family glucan-1,4-alpha-glucosidase